LIIYSGHANEKGLPQGSFFANGKAMIGGYVGAAASVGLTLSKGSVIDLLIAAAISFFVAAPILLGWLRSSVQITSIIGLPTGLLLMAAY